MNEFILGLIGSLAFLTFLLASIVRKSDLEVIHCSDCAIRFGLEPEHQKQRRRDHKVFHCPNGHQNIYPAHSA